MSSTVQRNDTNALKFNIFLSKAMIDVVCLLRNESISINGEQSQLQMIIFQYKQTTS